MYVPEMFFMIFSCGIFSKFFFSLKKRSQNEKPILRLEFMLYGSKKFTSS